MVDKVFLTGFRATGKSTVGKELARRLGWEFVDMDEKIVSRGGKSVSEMTDSGKSWQGFRQLEHDVLIDLLSNKKVVVATGGGVFVNDFYGMENLDAVRSDNVVKMILLTASDEAIAERIRADENGKSEVVRPVLNEQRAKHIDGEVDIESIVDDSMEMLNARKPLYDKLTDVVFDTGSLGVTELVEEIIKNLQFSS